LGQPGCCTGPHNITFIFVVVVTIMCIKLTLNLKLNINIAVLTQPVLIDFLPTFVGDDIKGWRRYCGRPTHTCRENKLSNAEKQRVRYAS